MSVAMTKSDGVTVLTLKSDPGSACPPLCQILQTLCYSPVCCSVSQKLRSVLGTSHSTLGTVQIMVGLLNMGLGALFCISRYAVVLYSINLAVMSFWWLCRDDNYYYSSWAPTNTPRSPEDMERCLEGKRIIQMVLGGVNVLLIILSVLQLCVSISCVVLGIKAVKKSFKKTDQVWLGGGGGEPERVNPWLNHFLGQYIPDNPRPCFVVIAMDFPGFNLIQTIINLNWGDIMSVAMTKSDGVTVLTLKSDPGSACPPLCQILQTLCYSPVCCSVSQKLHSVLGTSHSTLGTVQIMVGLLNMGLGALLCISRDDNYYYSSWAPTNTPRSPEDMERCLEGKRIIQLCVSISCVVLGIKAVKKSFKKTDQVWLGGGGGEPGTVMRRRRRRTRYSWEEAENQGEDPEHYAPLMAEKFAY
ncbi:hypothetical protein CRUP_019603 [Coryphaenoides rupestris]|nr:hypothetical protein CRUP_019603 [Coryphaenoides rupestris]